MSTLSLLRLLALSAIFCGLASGCRRLPETRHALTGTVVSVASETKTVVIDHDEIPGFMMAMRMPFHVPEERDRKGLHPGVLLRGTLVVVEDRSWLEEVTIVGLGPPPPAGPTPVAATGGLGQRVPDVRLVDQDGTPLSLASTSKDVVVLTFFFTRCTLPDFCPRMNGNLSALFKALSAGSPPTGGWRLLSVSFDPEHDTPEVLRRHGLVYQEPLGGPAFERWTFAAAEGDDLKTLTGFLGLSFWKDEKTFDHNLVTAVLDRGGTVRAIYRGNDWKVADVAAEVRKALATK